MRNSKKNLNVRKKSVVLRNRKLGQNKRSRKKFAALEPTLNLKTRYEELTDFDYIDKLNDKEKDWLNRFLEEEVNANFNHGGKILNKKKEDRKRCYDKNNARNRDVMSRNKAAGNYIPTSQLNETDRTRDEMEMLITAYDKEYNSYGKKPPTDED